jgi:hypothetical protein
MDARAQGQQALFHGSVQAGALTPQGRDPAALPWWCGRVSGLELIGALAAHLQHQVKQVV